MGETSPANAWHLSRRQLAVVLAGIADGITALNPAGELIYANDAAARLIGYPDALALLAVSRTEILRQFELFDETGQPLPADNLPGALALRGQMSPATVIRFRVVATGAERWSRVTSQAVYDEAGHIELAVTIFHEITELKRAELSQSLLAQAATLLSASLDYEIRLSHIAQLVVPHLGDWCAVDIINTQGILQRLSVAHIDPAKVELAYALQQRYPPRPEDRSGIYEVLRSGQSQLFPDIPAELLEAAITDPEQLETIRALRLRSVMIVPMIAPNVRKAPRPEKGRSRLRGRNPGVITTRSIWRWPKSWPGARRWRWITRCCMPKRSASTQSWKAGLPFAPPNWKPPTRRSSPKSTSAARPRNKFAS